jgi:hypothetical protein
MLEGVAWNGDRLPSGAEYLRGGVRGVRGRGMSYPLGFWCGDGVVVLKNGPGADMQPWFSEAGKVVASVWGEGRHSGDSVTVSLAELSGYSSAGKVEKVRSGESTFVGFLAAIEASPTVGGS